MPKDTEPKPADDFAQVSLLKEVGALKTALADLSARYNALETSCVALNNQYNQHIRDLHINRKGG